MLTKDIHYEKKQEILDKATQYLIENDLAYVTTDRYIISQVKRSSTKRKNNIVIIKIYDSKHNKTVLLNISETVNTKKNKEAIRYLGYLHTQEVYVNEIETFVNHMENRFSLYESELAVVYHIGNCVTLYDVRRDIRIITKKNNYVIQLEIDYSVNGRKHNKKYIIQDNESMEHFFVSYAKIMKTFDKLAK